MSEAPIVGAFEQRPDFFNFRSRSKILKTLFDFKFYVILYRLGLEGVFEHLFIIVTSTHFHSRDRKLFCNVIPFHLVFTQKYVIYI